VSFATRVAVRHIRIPTGGNNAISHRPIQKSALIPAAWLALMPLLSCGDSTEPLLATGLEFAQQPGTSIAGVTMTSLQVRIVTARGELVPDTSFAITIHVNSGSAGAQLLGTATRSSVGGIATFSDLSIQKAGAGYTLSASAGALAAATSAAFDVTPAAAAKVKFTVQPTSAIAGSSIAPAIAVSLFDAFDNVVAGATNPVSLGVGTNPASASLTGTTTVSAIAGVATFSNIGISKAGSGYTLTASASGLTGDVSSAFSVTPSSAAKLAFVNQPATVVGAQAISPAIQIAIQDAFGNVVTGASNLVTIAIGSSTSSATAFGTTSVNAAGGIATFSDLRIDRPGATNTLTASAASLTGTTSSNFAVGIRFASVTTGGTNPEGHFSCGVTVTSNAYCWGYNTVGQLGDGTTTARETPVLVAGGLAFTSIDAGSRHICGIAGGRVQCWGSNADGAIGPFPAVDRSTPREISSTLSFSQVSAGDAHSCGVTITGAGYCWGANTYGQLGDGSTVSKSTPTLVSGGLTFARVEAGISHSCGLTTDSTAYCWGTASSGLGTGDTFKTTPALVMGGFKWTSLALGIAHTCGITTAGAAYCWGGNGNAQLGDGTTTSRGTLELVSGGHTFAAPIGGGGWYHTCAITVAGPSRCWGYNANNQLGSGNPDLQYTIAQLVAGSLSFAQIAGARYHTCGVTPDGVAYCWGGTGGGELGVSSPTQTSTPIRVVQ
jgi:alpha-tubulin suppressor-like RCC1 family protein